MFCSILKQKLGLFSFLSFLLNGHKNSNFFKIAAEWCDSKKQKYGIFTFTLIIYYLFSSFSGIGFFVKSIPKFQYLDFILTGNSVCLESCFVVLCLGFYFTESPIQSFQRPGHSQRIYTSVFCKWITILYRILGPIPSIRRFWKSRLVHSEKFCLIFLFQNGYHFGLSKSVKSVTPTQIKMFRIYNKQAWKGFRPSSGM